MKIGAKIALLGLVAFLGVFATACPKRTSIADIQANPSKYQDKTIAVAGVVRDSYGLNIPGTQMRGGIYKIDDGTGSIWVVTQDTVPGKGAELGVEGRIGSGVNWNGRNYGLGMHEKQRKFRRR
jgi:hypothetical protein